jgi:hypothetical protein
MFLTTAVPSGARGSRANRHQNRRAAYQREGYRGEQDEPSSWVISLSKALWRRLNIPNV